MITGFIVMTLVTLIQGYFSETLIRLFVNDLETIQKGKLLLRFLIFTCTMEYVTIILETLLRLIN